MPQVQKNLINFLRKNIVLAVTVIVLVTSFISVSAMEIVAPIEFKPSKGVQRILNLDSEKNEKNKSQIAKSEEIESESSSVASVSSSMVSSISQSETSEEKMVEESSSTSSGNKQETTSSSTSSSYSASSSSSTSSNSAVIKSSSSTAVQSANKTQGSPLCQNNIDHIDITKKQQKSWKKDFFSYRKMNFIVHKDSSTIQDDKLWFLYEGRGSIECYYYTKFDELFDNEEQLKEYATCSQTEIKNLQTILQTELTSDFKCVKDIPTTRLDFDILIYNAKINELYEIDLHKTRNLKEVNTVNIVEYFCDSNDEFMETEWVPRTPENDYMCATDWE